MPFPIDDLSQPFRRPSELRRLVQAVREAGDYDETRWIEWKSRLVLDDRSGQLHLVKQILGFANRDPRVAAQWCQGNAYLLVGVSPGELHGVTEVDPQVLVQSLQPHLGTEIIWNPEYIKVEGLDVLVVEVAPPSPGDPIHFLMKDLFITKTVQTSDGPKTKTHGFHEGTIFIRRPGETERANHEERQMLLRRARSSGARLKVDVIPGRPTIESAPPLEDRLAPWVPEERERLLAARYQPQSDRSHPEVSSWLLRSFDLAVGKDPRTWEQYEAQVDDYLIKMREALRGSVAGDLEEHSPAHLALTLVNNGERPFQGVQVTVTIIGEGVRCITPGELDTVDADEFPDPPAPYGTPQPKPLFSDFSNAVYDLRRSASQIVLPTRWEAERGAEGLKIVFDPVDLRAHARVPLEPVPLYIDPAAQSPLTVHWIAAGLDSHGQDTGTFALTVIPSTLELLKGWQEELEQMSDDLD